MQAAQTLTDHLAARKTIAPLEAGTWGNGTWGNGTWGNGTWGNGTWGNSMAPLPTKQATTGKQLPIIENITWGNITWGNITWGNITWGNITWGNTIVTVPNARAQSNRDADQLKASAGKRSLAQFARNRGEVVIAYKH